MTIPNKVIQKRCISASRRESRKVTTFGAKIHFTKMVASGNDFIVIDQLRGSLIQRPKSLAVQICNRKYGSGADGLLILEKTKNADAKMRIFNPDGSEPQMCGNGARCVGLWLKSSTGSKDKKSEIIRIATKAGILQARVNKDRVNIRMSQPKDIKLDLPIKINGRTIRLNLINTGVPHAVIFAEGLDKIDVVNIGRQIRFHRRFLPEGVNVDFVRIIDDNNIKLRTYERGVEDETLACGTGAVAAALLYAIRYTSYAIHRINIHTKGGDILSVEFDRMNAKFKDVWLGGKARIVYSGVYYV